MGNKLKVAAAVIFTTVVIGAGAYLLRNADFAVLQPRGEIAQGERGILLFAALLSLIIVVPVFMLTFFIVWRYRESNTRAKYKPHWQRNKTLETIWWGIPIILILILSVVTWQSSHKFDPFRPLDSAKKPLTIQVVALQWKWLFIYPEQNIAVVNFAQFPVDTPINFEITADAPMNSFWIPQLGGQIYAMSGMSTKLHLNATSTGSYQGVSANLSGTGFAGMHFIAQASTNADFDTWVADVQKTPGYLNLMAYDQLAQPSQNMSATYYGSVDSNLYDTIIMKFMAPTDGAEMHNHKTMGY